MIRSISSDAASRISALEAEVEELTEALAEAEKERAAAEEEAADWRAQYEAAPSESDAEALEGLRETLLEMEGEMQRMEERIRFARMKNPPPETRSANVTRAELYTWLTDWLLRLRNNEHY